MDLKKKLPYLRIVCNYSDGCNFNCSWCHHEGIYKAREYPLMTPQQIGNVSAMFYKLGVRKYKILGGEPTLREDLDEIIYNIRNIDEDIDISIVTNGHRLENKIIEYKNAGLTRVNVSLFTLDEEYFEKNIGNINLFRNVIRGIDAAVELGMVSKINHIYHNTEDFIQVLRFASKRDIRVNLLNEIPSQNGGKYTDIRKLVNLLQEIGVKSAEIENDPFSLPVMVYKLTNGVSVEIKHLTICEQKLFNTCEGCYAIDKCKEGIFAVRLTPEGKVRPCLVRTDNQFEIMGKNNNELRQYLHEL